MDNWKHRSAGMACQTCMWCVKKVTPERDLQEDQTRPPTVGRCRRHAPTMNGYPVVYMTDWCGDHKLDETKI